MNHQRLWSWLIAIGLGLAAGVPWVQAAPLHQGSTWHAEALVLLNSASADYADFEHNIQPYLDHFGIPYSTLDIATTAVTSAVADYAVLIIGHRQFDPAHTYLSGAEEAIIESAVNTGSGLINFDDDLATAGLAGRYTFIQNIFGFSYGSPVSIGGITFHATEGLPAEEMHYVVGLHEAGSLVPTTDMVAANLDVPLNVKRLVSAEGHPVLSVTSYGQGRAVQWSSTDWISYAVRGPMGDLDDLIWRGIVWAARKPFALQGLPPLVTMRMDDVSGPLDWLHTANTYSFKPWAGLFIDDLDASEAADLSALVHGGHATAAVHAFSTPDFFYYNDAGGSNWPDATVTSNFATATAWHTANNVPISKYVVAHHYELGSNVFEELGAWGVEFVGIHMNPGLLENSPWIMNGPYRLYQTGNSTDGKSVTYADFLSVPGHPELDNQFFNCVTEIRDDAGYEWYPSNDVAQAVGRGTRQLKRALNSMTIATLFTHEYNVTPITPANWSDMLSQITTNIAGYAPQYVTQDYACQYARAMRTSHIASSLYTPSNYHLTITLNGRTDLPTQVLVFTENGNVIQSTAKSVPIFDPSTELAFNISPTAVHTLTLQATRARATTTPIGLLALTAGVLVVLCGHQILRRIRVRARGQ